jgi:hypothetical protein
MLVGGIIGTSSTSIESIMGSRGKKPLVCVTYLNQEFCLAAKNVEEWESGYSVCFELQTKLVGGMVTVFRDLQCVNVMCSKYQRYISHINIDGWLTP